jgi:hypothetical protein
MSSVERTGVHRGQVPFLAGASWSFPLAGACAGGGGACWRELRAVTARKAWASMDKVTCRYQARYLRTW